MPSLSDWYAATLGVPPYPYQQRLADEDWPDVLKIPTGLGKTAAIFLAWLYKRHSNASSTPRRLVWCLPMRVLVGQTAQLVAQWGERLVSAGLLVRAPAVHVLMGGHVAHDWDTRPEDEAVLVGTQDQLLSRALNRGYAMSRFRWPLDFALLHNDAFWIFDEVQLMGAALPTSTQLEAFRQRFGCALPCRSLWCSATLHPKWLASVDFAAYRPAPRVAQLEDDDRAFPQVHQRIQAKKMVHALDGADNNTKLADAVLEQHRPGTLTLVIRNRVKDAVDLFVALNKRKNTPPISLLHSRFRPDDKNRHLQEALAAPNKEGRIVVTTQVVEAGVDISAATLFDVAPWSSLVQRFGRSNRAGERDDARIFWLDRPLEKEQEARPYALESLKQAKQMLLKLENAAPARLADVDIAEDEYPVLRAPDVLDLFDTTPDLAGADIDVSRFIRETEDSDVQVFWRSWEGDVPPRDMPGPDSEELCPVPLGDMRAFCKKAKKQPGWLWDALEGDWQRADHPRPGMVLLLRDTDGGYSREVGWNADPKSAVDPITHEETTRAPSLSPAMDSDPGSHAAWQSLREHGERTATEFQDLLTALDNPVPSSCLPSLLTAARRHDWGKAHHVFQEACDPADLQEIWAKAPRMRPYARPGFRHELASALALLQTGHDDLAVYLAAAHHGKIRLSLRALPNESAPRDEEGALQDERHFARGILEGDKLPPADGLPEVVLSLACMELGYSAEGASWAERMGGLLETWGPFRLAFWEALVRVADWRASAGMKHD